MKKCACLICVFVVCMYYFGTNVVLSPARAADEQHTNVDQFATGDLRLIVERLSVIEAAQTEILLILRENFSSQQSEELVEGSEERISEVPVVIDASGNVEQSGVDVERYTLYYWGQPDRCAPCRNFEKRLNELLPDIKSGKIPVVIKKGRFPNSGNLIPAFRVELPGGRSWQRAGYRESELILSKIN